jgi:hypothetical protein
MLFVAESSCAALISQNLLCCCHACCIAVFALQECQGRAAGPAAAAAAGPSSSSSQQVLLQRRQQQPYHVPRAHEAEGDDDELAAPAITFKLLMKKGGKDDRSRELHVSRVVQLSEFASLVRDSCCSLCASSFAVCL